MPIFTNRCRQRLESGGLALGFGVHHMRGSATGMVAAAAARAKFPRGLGEPGGGAAPSLVLDQGGGAAIRAG